MTTVSPKPFVLRVPDTVIADLRERLARTRWPDEPPLEPWSTGTSMSHAKRLIEYWRTGFEWRAWEAKLNAFRQYTVPIGGIDLHFIHEPGRRPDAMPLLISHGWPGSVFEFYKLIPMLTEHFTVIAPSLPGYSLSFKPGQKRFGVEDIAGVFAGLITDVLGYARFSAQGGDWGTFITSVLRHRYPEPLTGIHLNLLAGQREPVPVKSPTAEESKYFAEPDHWLKKERGYQWIRGRGPQTLAFGLSDSPSGLTAWIVEKFRFWTDCGGNPENAVSRDEILANISLYWLTGSIGASFWPYYARLHGPWPIPDGETVRVPTSYAEFPKEILHPPRSIAERTYSNVQRWSVMQRGGHFVALEQPDALAYEIREFFRGCRRSDSLQITLCRSDKMRGEARGDNPLPRSSADEHFYSIVATT